MRFRKGNPQTVPKFRRAGRRCSSLYCWTHLILVTILVFLVNLLLYTYSVSFGSLIQLQQNITSQWNRNLNVPSYPGKQSLFNWLPEKNRTFFNSAQEFIWSKTSHRVSIWDPAGECNGIFTSEAAKHGSHDIPYAMVREAVIDRRVATDRHFLRNNPQMEGSPSVRIIFYITAHLSVRLTSINSTAALHLSDGTQSTHLLNVDYVLQTEPFLNLFSHTAYKPGKVNQKGLALAEWQVSVSVVPSLSFGLKNRDELIDHLIQLSQFPQGTTIRLSLTLLRYDNVVIRFEPSMSLACVTGWVMPSAYPLIARLNGEPTCSRGHERADGAVLFSGSFLYGSKNRHARYYTELAHFAARGLHGPMKFSNVVLSILPLYSISHMSLKCKDETACWGKLKQENRQHLEEIRDVIETEFIELGVKRASFQDVIIMPGCRLGSHASGTEESTGPCGKSYKYGQYMAKVYGYAMLSPFYKWAFSYDWDEVILATPSRFRLKRRQGPAEKLLDASDTGRRGYLTFKWLNFLASAESARNFTTDLMTGQTPKLVPKRGQEGNRVNCWGKQSPTGKPAVRCDLGLGMTIHASVVWESSRPGPSLIMRQVTRPVRTFRTWHPRLGSSSGMCAYVHV